MAVELQSDARRCLMSFNLQFPLKRAPVQCAFQCVGWAENEVWEEVDSLVHGSAMATIQINLAGVSIGVQLRGWRCRSRSAADSGQEWDS